MEPNHHVTVTLLLLTALVAVIPVSTERVKSYLIKRHTYVTKFMYSPIKKGEKPIRCTGAIYNENWIITSARCALPTWKRKIGQPTHDIGDIIYGNDNYVPDCKCEDVEDYRFIADVEFPPDVEGALKNGTLGPKNDIAMIKPSEPFKLSRNLKAVLLPEGPEHCASDKASLFGWGVTGGGTKEEDWSNEFREIEIKTMKEAECTQSIPDYDPERLVCGKAKKKKNGDTSCHSDTGGPLIQLNSIKLKQAPVSQKYPVLCGVLPISVCDRTDVQEGNVVEYFSNVLKHLDWIKQVGGEQSNAPML